MCLSPHLSHGVTDLPLLGGMTIHLVAGGEESEHVVGHLLELGMRLVRGVNEVLDLAHRELTEMLSL